MKTEYSDGEIIKIVTRMSGPRPILLVPFSPTTSSTEIGPRFGVFRTYSEAGGLGEPDKELYKQLRQIALPFSLQLFSAINCGLQQNTFDEFQHRVINQVFVDRERLTTLRAQPVPTAPDVEMIFHRMGVLACYKLLLCFSPRKTARRPVRARLAIGEVADVVRSQQDMRKAFSEHETESPTDAF